jgi:hypothetical protein
VPKEKLKGALKTMNLFDASIEVSLVWGYSTMEFAGSGGALNHKRE